MSSWSKCCRAASTWSGAVREAEEEAMLVKTSSSDMAFGRGKDGALLALLLGTRASLLVERVLLLGANSY